MAGDKKKKVTKKNNSNKKVTKVTETQLPKLVEEAKEQTVVEEVDIEKFKDEKGEYDLTNATEEEVKSVFNQLKDDDEVVVTNKKKVEVVNGDPAVIAPKEEVVDKKESGVKKIINKFNQSFGYLWNGQAIDF